MSDIDLPWFVAPLAVFLGLPQWALPCAVLSGAFVYRVSTRWRWQKSLGAAFVGGFTLPLIALALGDGAGGAARWLGLGALAVIALGVAAVLRARRSR